MHFSKSADAHHINFPKNILRRGFNLIEAAIVLGVVGLVIGGIWVAAASVNFNYRLSKTQEEILSIVTNTERLFKGAPYSISSSDLLNAIFRSDAIPAYMKTSTQVINQFGGGFFFQYSNKFLTIFITELTRSECTQLAVMLTSTQVGQKISEVSFGMAFGVGLMAAYVYSSPPLTAPVTLQTAASYCVNSGNTLALTYELNFM